MESFAGALLGKIQTVGLPALVSVVVFGVLIAVHEYGHFLAARLCGVPVEEYAVGFGKSLLQWKKGETTYRLNMVPLGGYCRIVGMNPEEEDFDNPKGFNKQGGWVRFLILFGGPLFNLVLGLALAIGIFLVFGQSRQVVALLPMKGGPAQVAGVKEGDLALALNGREITSAMDFINRVQQSGGKPLRLKVMHPATGKTSTLVVRPKRDHGQFRIQAGVLPQELLGRRVVTVLGNAGQLQPGDTLVAIGGVTFKSDLQFSAFMASTPDTLGDRPAQVIYRDASGAQQVTVTPVLEKAGKDMFKRTFLTAQQFEPMPVGKAVSTALAWPVQLFKMQFEALARLAQGKTEGIGGPVAILNQVAQSAKSGLYEVLWISALLNFAIGFFNLLPVPALDGGRISVVAVEGLLGRRMNPVWEARLHTAGFLLLIGLILLVSVQDFRNLIFK